MRLYLVRHAAVTPDPTRDGFHWHLSPEGRAGADALAADAAWAALDVIHTSPEPKACATAQRIAAAHELPLRFVPDLHEVTGRAWMETRDAYQDAARRYLAGDTVDGWEPRAGVLARVRAAIDAIAAPGGDAAAVSHGLALMVYLSDLLSLDAATAFEMWRSIRFPDVAMVDPRTRRLEKAFGAA